jgi:hypothetical protein
VNLNTILLTLQDLGWTEMRKRYNPDCCLDAGAVVLDVLDHFGITGKALCAKAHVVNQEAQQWIEQYGKVALQTDPPKIIQEWHDRKCKLVGIGYENGKPGYAGHLVVICPYPEGRYGQVLIDISIQQADRPDFGITLQPVIAEASPEFVEGKEPLLLEMEGILLRYEAEPGRDDYRETPAWHHTRQRRSTVGKLIREIKKQAKRQERTTNVGIGNSGTA